MQVVKYMFQPHGDKRGQLVAFEELKDIPFKIKRVYYMYDTLAGVVRGKHAHKDLEQILVCICGSCKVLFDDGHEKKIIHLEKPYEGLYMPKHIWAEQFDFAPGTVLLVFASELYDESDYIRNYDEFLELIKSKDNIPPTPPHLAPTNNLVTTWNVDEKNNFPVHGDKDGKLISLEEFRDIPFRIKRVYYMYDTLAGVVRGKHAHKNLAQILVCVHGSCKIILDDGSSKKIVPLEKPYEGLYVTNDIWREMYDFSSDAVLLVFASELYDESDYIRNYEDFLEFVKGRKNEN